jgi:glycosyltransferase involved in cell wall biosynthesis
MKNITLIISVYKKVKELEILLTALTKQTFKDFNVIIADDGSGAIISDFIDKYREGSGLEIEYVTQEDKGFRKNRILNEAVRKSDSEYVIFLDSDCIPHKDFVKAHKENSEKRTVLVGRRVHLNEGLSSLLSKEYVLSKAYDGFYLKALTNSVKTKNASTTAEEGIIIKNRLLRKFQGARNNHIDGFDENYTGAGIGEDTDVEYRLGLIDAKFKSVRNLAVVFHIHHTKTKEENDNYEYFHKKVKSSGVYYCENGINKQGKEFQG